MMIDYKYCKKYALKLSLSSMLNQFLIKELMIKLYDHNDLPKANSLSFCNLKITLSSRSRFRFISHEWLLCC